MASQQDGQPSTEVEHGNEPTDNKASDDKITKVSSDIGTFYEILFLLFGTNVLMTYNTFLNGIDFYDKLFPNKGVSTSIARVFNIAASATFFISLPFIERFSVKLRFYLSSILTIIINIYTMFYSNSSNPNLNVVLFIVAISAIVSGILSGTTMGYSGLFGVNASSMATSGLALSGLFAAMFRILSKLMGSFEGWFYFGICILINIVSLFAFYYFQQTETAEKGIKNSKISSDFFERWARITDVFKKVKWYIFEAALCMIITLTLFPGYASKTKSKHGLEKWSTTIVLTSYMIGDFLGRILTRWYSWPSPPKLIIPHLLRLLFFPFYMLSIQGIILDDDYWIYFITFILAVSGGFFLTLCITYTSRDPSLNSDEVELAVFSVTLWLNIGIFIGSWLTYLMP